MKRLLLALMMLAAGAIMFWVSRGSAARLRSQCGERRGAWLAQRQLLAQTRLQRAELASRVRELKRSLLAQGRESGGDSWLADLVATKGAKHLPPEAREKLLAELGFDWNSVRDYVVLSKDSLPRLELEPIRGNRLTDTVCGVLAVTAEERAKIDSLLTGAATEFNGWALSHVQRAEPEGEILAQYTIPIDQQFSQNLSNTIAADVVAALGSERGTLMLDYGSSWMLGLGLRGSGPTILTVKRPPAGRQELPFELKTPDGGTMYTTVSPGQPLPEAFRPVFPGGWSDLAAREGFELPKEFRTK